MRRRSRMGRSLKPLAAAGTVIVVVNTAASATCRTAGQFLISSEGPWPMSMVVSSGGRCGSSYQLGFPGTHLYLVSAPGHGRLSLRQGGHYNYVGAAGYRGADEFTLRLCGRIQGAATESCANLKYAVTVE